MQRASNDKVCDAQSLASPSLQWSRWRVGFRCRGHPAFVGTGSGDAFGEVYMKRRLIGSGSSFESEIGYSRAVVQGDWVFVSGTTGFDYPTMTISDDIETQAEQCLKNIAAALESAGSGLSDVVRVTYVLPDGSEFPRCWPVLKKYFGAVRPAAMMISAGLADPRMKIEIEVTALKQAR